MSKKIYKTEQLLEIIRRSETPFEAMLISDFGSHYDMSHWFEYSPASDSMFVECLAYEQQLTTPEEFLLKYKNCLWQLLEEYEE